MSAGRLFLCLLALGLFGVQGGSAYETESCKLGNCVLKCCPPHQSYLTEYGSDGYEKSSLKCTDSSDLKKLGVKDPDNYSAIDVYKKDIERELIKAGKIVDVLKFGYDANFTSGYSSCLGNLTEFPLKSYFLEDGRFVLRRINYWKEWIISEAGEFCLEHEVSVVNGTLASPTPSVVVWVLPGPPPPTNSRAITSSYGLLVSCVFLLLVLVVYALLPELRNLAGLILMACMATYFAFFLIRVIHVFGNENMSLSTNACITLTIIFHFLTLSTFCWMNIMSFDLWWTFRGMRKAIQINRRGGMSKFRRYCAYAWGLPLLVTVFVVIVDRVDLTHLPNFVTPHMSAMCYFTPEVHLLYVSVPILILIGINVILFLLTTSNIWEVNRGGSVTLTKNAANNKEDESQSVILAGSNWGYASQIEIESGENNDEISNCKEAENAKDKKIETTTSCPSGGHMQLSILTAEVVDSVNNAELSFFYLFWVYFRLSLLMGVSWILEVIGNLVDTQSPVWVISDLYNSLIGLFIFLLFVCKKKIFLQLCTRLNIDNEWIRRMRASDYRAPDATKTSCSEHTDASDVETWTPSYKDIRNKAEGI